MEERRSPSHHHGLRVQDTSCCDFDSAVLSAQRSEYPNSFSKQAELFGCEGDILYWQDEAGGGIGTAGGRDEEKHRQRRTETERD